MDNALYSAVSGLAAIERKFENATYNTVNAHTPGFQRQRVLIESFGAFLPDSDETRELVGAREIISFEQGTLRNSDLPHAVGLDGPGFLVVDDGQGGRLYTRNGDLAVDAAGTLRTRSGFAVLNTDQLPITIPTQDGKVGIDGNGAIVQQGAEVARLQVVEFGPEDLKAMKPFSETLFAASDEANAQPAIQTAVRHGYLEVPKYGGVQGMVEMLMVKKNYESMQRALRALDKTKERLIAGVE